MFTTFDAFKQRIQLSRQVTNWLAVELTLGHPLFLLSGIDAEGFERVFFLDGTSELLAFATQQPIGPIVGLQLLQPPKWSKEGKWSLVPMLEVLLQECPPDGSMSGAVARGIDGALYGGFPLGQLRGNPGPLRRLAALRP
jgi:hypothetical protein